MLRKKWAIRAAEAHKAVLVEKPVGATAADAEEIIAACQRNGVQFMDGVMFMHSQRLNRLRKTLDDAESVGSIRRITSQFSFAGDDEFLRTNIRTNAELEPLGCLGDLGWYCVRFALWAMRYQLPLQAIGRIHSESRNSSVAGRVPTEFSGDLLFADGVSASFHCSFVAHNAQWATVSGTKGYVLVPDFVLPFAGSQTGYSLVRSEFVLNGCQFDMHEGGTQVRLDEPSNNAPRSQEANLFCTLSDLVLSGKTDFRWAEIALKTQQVVDACLRSAKKGAAVAIAPADGLPPSQSDP
jgi:predicted dehydrogenase